MKKSMVARALFAPLSLTLGFIVPLAVQAQAPRSAPVTVPISPGIQDAVDTPWPGGTIALDIDATDITRGVFRVVETIPVAAGTSTLILQYPQWLPGNHGPRGPLPQIADMHFFADGQEIRWTRDPVEVFAFHLALPQGTREVTARFVHTSPLQTSEGRIVMTREMLNLQWEKMSLYPAGHYVRQIMVKPVVTFPQGWAVSTALDGQAQDGNRVTWDVVDYEQLVDSPIFAGKYARNWDLGHGVSMNVVADKPELLDAKPENMARYNTLVDEALATFGARHFDRYTFLLALTDRMGGIGLEHQRSSENQYEPKALTQWDEYDWGRNVIAHEFVHSWDGKYRRPAKMWTPDYRQPMQGNLLWVYEGQTQFWGLVLAARSGIQTKETILGALAGSAGLYSELPGREWRSVEDTTHDPIFGARRPKPFASLSRGEDYYNEGALVWLEADQIIRAGTGGKKGLDDFAKAFFGVRDGDIGQLTYDFADVVGTLNSIYPYDWANFLETRIETPGQPAPLGGVERAGYRLVWKDAPNPYDKARMGYTKTLNLYHSLGITLNKDGGVTSTRWDSPAFDAGIVTDAKIVAVNGTAYDPDILKAAITAAKGADGVPVELLVKRGDSFQTIAVNWTGGLRWPWLEPVGKGEQALDRLLASRTKSIGRTN